MKRKREITNRAALSFPSLSQNESLARAFVTAFMVQLNPTVADIADMKCAVSEAVTNCIVHGYKDVRGEIRMKCLVDSEMNLTVEISDRGCGIADFEEAKKPFFTTDTSGDRSGMGFMIMESFTDAMSVKTKPGKGTKVTLKRKLSESDPINT
ncbi:MAG: anti-sigma F factor [Clostridia bacterium]|nr:anti-sigma F factor [Clostridia bacterium]